jgi:DNA repair exonuclease SbcCD nuclease subunit
MRFLFRTDVHLSDRGPVSWKGDYTEEILDCLKQIGQLAKKVSATAVLDGGDYFHLKAPTRNPHWIVEKSAEIHKAYPCPTYSVVGNHDITHNNLDTLEKQPLGVLLKTGVFQYLREQVFEEGGLRVRVVGVSYSPFLTLEELRAIKKKPGDTHLIAVVHALAMEKPTGKEDEIFKEPVFRYADLVSRDGPDCFCFGHYHKDQGVIRVKNVQFVNQGAVSRGSLSRENLERAPKVAILEVTGSGVQIQSVPLKVLPVEEAFDLDRKQRLDREEEVINQFIQQMKLNVTQDSSEDIDSTLSSMGDFAKDVRELAREYLERARVSRGKGKH